MQLPLQTTCISVTPTSEASGSRGWKGLWTQTLELTLLCVEGGLGAPRGQAQRGVPRPQTQTSVPPQWLWHASRETPPPLKTCSL